MSHSPTCFFLRTVIACVDPLPRRKLTTVSRKSIYIYALRVPLSVIREKMYHCSVQQHVVWNMQNYCKCIIPHAKLQLHNIPFPLRHVDTNLRSGENARWWVYGARKVQHAAYYDLLRLRRGWTLYFLLPLDIANNVAGRVVLYFSSCGDALHYQISALKEASYSALYRQMYFIFCHLYAISLRLSTPSPTALLATAVNEESKPRDARRSPSLRDKFPTDFPSRSGTARI